MMTTEDAHNLERAIELAKDDAQKNNAELLVVIDNYAEHDRERFNHCPAEAFGILYRLPNAAAVLGIVHPNGEYQPIGEMIAKILQASNAADNTASQLLKALVYLVRCSTTPNLGALPAARTLANQAITFARARGVQS